MLRQITHIFDPHHQTVPLYQLPQNKPVFSSDPHPFFLRALPEEVGISSAHLASFLSDLGKDARLNMHNLLILKNKKVILDFSFRGYDTAIPKYTYSACKSLVSLAIGVLTDRGVLSPMDKIEKYLPKNEINPLVHLKIKDLTIAHLLTMSSGCAFSEFSVIAEENWLRGCLSATFKTGNDTLFEYNSMNTYLLSHIIKSASGKSLTEIMTEAFYKPMGITDTFWEVCPGGVERGGWGLYIRPEDFAKFGVLLLQNGIWEGNRLISEAYLKEATTVKRKTPKSCGDFDYGYHIWIGKDRDTLLFNGMHGQNLLIDRASETVFVTNAGNDDIFQQSDYFDYVKRYFFDAPHQTALAINPKGTKALKKAKEAIQPQGREVLTPALPGLLSRIFAPRASLPTRRERAALKEILNQTLYADPAKTKMVGLLPNMFQVTQGCYASGLHSVCFRKQGDDLLMDWTEKEQKHTLLLGYGAPKVGKVMVCDSAFLVGGEYRPGTDEEGHFVLMIRLDMLEMPYSRFLKLRFLSKNQAALRLTERPGAGFLLRLGSTVLDTLKAKPFIGQAASKLDPDYLDFTIRRVMEPTLLLTARKPSLTPPAHEAATEASEK